MFGEPLPTFFGLALHDPCKGACKDPRENESRRIVFAAGPGGLYVFDNGGTILGRVMFDEPVSGLALSGKEVYGGGGEGSAPTRYRLYLVVGHMLCSLIFKDPTEAPGTNTAVNPPESGSTLTQPEQPVPPRPRATQGKLVKPDSPSDPSKPWPGPTDHKPQNPMQPASPPHNNNPRGHCAKRESVPPNTTPPKDQSNCDCEREKSNSP
jgi:hypothetical protein